MIADITFCMSDCARSECFRHKSNIKEPQYPHSFSDFKGTTSCPYWNGTRSRMRRCEDSWDRYCDLNGIEEE